MEDNRTKPSVKTYLLHWFDYCYYRIVQLYTPEGTKDEDIECGYGSMFVGFFFVSIVLIILGKTNPEIVEFTQNHRFLYAAFFAVVCYFTFPETMYFRGKELFSNESHKTRIILGILVFLTIFSPIIWVIMM